MQLYTEITPNPSTLKFISDHIFLSSGTSDYPEGSSLESSPLAKKLYAFRFTKGVFIGRNFITVTKAEEFKWEDLIPLIKDSIRSFIETGMPAVIKSEETVPSAENDDEVVKKIKLLLEEQIRPAVAMDGGDIIFQSFEEGIVRLKMQGSCSGCPSSTLTLKAGIEGLLTRMVPEVKQVEAV